ncbi:PREDICTED: mucin-17-like [Eufriesea mexicana]|uniref:mucin-17-like n=1 Tax=Eufriesea mexicana TaxID=516756 RepID=UPI00083C431F|nr:PREDICTED: mucin-17-like [Eufriesea mexicana]
MLPAFIEDHKTTNRGSLRFNPKSLEEATTASPLLTRFKTTRGRSAQSKRLSFDKPNDASTLTSIIDSVSSFDSSKESNLRTTRTTERGSLFNVRNDSRRSTSEKKPEEPKKDLDSTVNRRNGKRYFSETNEGPNPKGNGQKVSLGTSKGFARRSFNGRASVTERLDNKGPSVFLATTESSRSRTGRKIQTTYSMKDLKTQIPNSRRYTKKFEDLETTTVSFRRDGRGRSTTEKTERSTRSGRSKIANRENNYITRRGPDPLLTESESVRVDIPFEVGSTETPFPDATTAFTTVAQRRSDSKESIRSSTRTGSERPKNRGRVSDSEAAGSSKSGARRGSSKFSDSTTTEPDEQIVSSRKNAFPRDRSRGADVRKNSVIESRSRSRGRNLENNVKPVPSGNLERDAKRKVAGERNSSERRSRILDANFRSAEIRGQDAQDLRGRSRNRPKLEATTPVITDVTSTVAPDTTVSNDVTTTESEATNTTIKPTTPAPTTSSPRTTTRPASTYTSTSTSTTESPSRGRGRGRGSQGRKQKEDFFNHGLGFRGRKPSPEGSSNVSDSRRFSPSKNDSYGNPGWTLRRRPAHVNNFERTENTSRTVVPSPRDQTNEVIPPNEQSTSTEASTTTESSTSTTRKGFKKPQLNVETSTVAGVTTKSSRRGNKTFGFGKGSGEYEESDNYPPEFKARLNQLKNINTKIPAPNTTSRSPLEERRKSIYGRRSRNNSRAFELHDLETSASGNVMTDENLVVNPLTLINGTGLRRVKKSSAALFAERSRMKLELARRLVKPELNIEENDLDATTASSFSKPKPNGVPMVNETSKVAKYPKPAATGRRSPTSVENSRDEVSAKASKLAGSRKGLEDSSKVTGRPYSLKKERIIAERMVTSISIEKKATVEDTTRPYVLSTNQPVIRSVEDGSVGTIDSTRIRVANGCGGKKSKEEDSTWKHAKVSLYSTRSVENSDPVTTVKPKIPCSYQSHNSKSQDQSTTIEQTSTTSVPKKSYTSTQRKQQTSQEEGFGKKSKFSSSATKPTFRPRYSKRTKQKSVDEKTIDYQVTVTMKVPMATSRYSRKKSAVNAADEKSKSATSQGPPTQTRKAEFRPRTATYRRHSEVPTTLVESSTRVDGAGVAITPRSSKYHATMKTTTVSPRSVAQEPQVNLRIANESTPETPGITGSSNGDSGNTNIFNPTRSTFLSGNSTLLEQLRSTVAPLLSSLGNKTPVFSGAYSNVNTANSPPRITPNGQPPRFSARYKGAELFIRKQNNIYQPTVPSITSSSTTPVTPVENSGLPPPIDVSSPGEPRFLTLYQALESVSVRNEQLQGNASMQREEQVGMVPQVDSNAAVANGIGDNANNDTTSPTVATSSPQTPDTTANTIQDSTQTPRLPEDTENSTPAVTTGAPSETPSTTEPVFTSTEPSSSTEQASTSTESLADNEQVSTSTVSSSTTEQISTNADTMPVTEQTTTESPSRTTEATTMNVGGAVDSRLSAQVDNSTTNQELVSSTTDAPMTTSSAPEVSSTELDESTSTTVASTEAQNTEAQRLVSEANVTSRVDVSENTIETTTASMMVTTTQVTTSENPETNTIPLSETTVTQTVEVSSTTETPTTEAESSNMIDVETTTAIPTSTTRNRLIDFAQDILSRLQASMSTSTVPTQDSTTTISPATEISNVIPDSSSNSSVESLSQLRSETTTVQGESTTLSSVMTEQSSLRTAEEVTTQSAVGSISTPSPTMVPTPGANTQDEINAFTITTPATMTTVTSTQDSQTVSSTDSTTVGDSNGSSTPLDVEVTSASTTTSTNDTLLTELMSIAKTLFTEGINDTQQETPGQNSNVTARLGNLMANEIDRPSLSSDVLSTTETAESSSIPPDVTTESVESSSTTIAMSESSTFSIDPSQNELNSTDPTTTVSSESTTDTPTTTPQSNAADGEVESVQTTESTSVGPLAEIIESTTSSFMTETGSEVTLSNRGPDTTTQTQTIISTTQSSDTTVTPTTNFELTTNTSDLSLSNLIATTNPTTASEPGTESVTEPAGTSIPLTSTTTVTSQLVTDTTTNQSEVTTVTPETTPSSVNTITPSTSPETNTEQTTMTPTVALVQRVNDVDVETNPTTELTTQLASLTTDTSGNEILEATTPSVATTAPLDVSSMDDTGVTTNQSPLTSSTMSAMETTTNPPSETANFPQTTPTLENETPTVVARFQDSTSATAQGTAGSGIGQTTEISTMIPDSSTTPSSTPESSTSSPPESSLIRTTSSSVETTTTATMTTETTTSTSTGTSTPQTTRMDVVTVTPMTETTTPVDIAENLVSTEAGTKVSSESTTVPTSSDQASTNDPTSTTPANTAMQMTTVQTTPGVTVSTTTSFPTRPLDPTTPYVGRFGGSRLTPAPRFSLSSTTKGPLRDYLVYGIYPNKTIVRKRPEDNLIDARNVDSPYVIFGIFPDGKLVRKFPNGTIIPDPPRSPVEVVFSLSTSTTTNRPPPRPYYNQANQGTYNQYQGPVYSNNGRPVAEPMRNVQSPGTVDLGLTGNAIVGPNGGGPDNTGPLGTPASVPSTNEMSNALLNTQMGTTSVTPIVSTGRPPTDSQGGRIVQDRERDEATRTKEAGGQRSSVYIGQDKFVNYWTDGASTSNPRVLSVNINSVASAANDGPSTSIPSFENLLNNQPRGQVTAPPGFPWRDPLDQIFGITTSSPVISASVASNTLDDSSEPNGPVLARPINPFVEVFTPFSSVIGVPRGNVGTVPPPPSSTTPASTTTNNTPAPTTTITTGPTTTTTTTMAPTTITTITTMAPTTTTTTTMAPTTTTTTTVTTTMAPTTTTMTAPTTTTQATTAQRANIVSQVGADSGTSASQKNSFNLPKNLLHPQQQNAFGTTFDDLAFLNSLLQSNSRSTTPKTLTHVEQLLANKILALALKNAGPTRAPKAIDINSVSSNSIFGSATKSPSEPIVIDLSPSSTVSSVTWASLDTQQPTSQRPIVNSTPERVTWKPVRSTTTKKDIEINTIFPSTAIKSSLISTTKAPVTVKAKPATTPRVTTTSPAPFGFAGLLWQTLLGGSMFGPLTTPKPVKAKLIKTTQKSVNITPKPIQSTQKPTQSTQKPTTTTVPSTTTMKTVDISKIHVNTLNSIVKDTVSSTKLPLLNNPNTRLPNMVSTYTSTYSPEEDAKFLVELLRAVEQDNKVSDSRKAPGLYQDDESFLKAILSGRAYTTTTTPPPTTEISNAALLAALLKARGIEPSTPPTNIRQQLLSASLGQSVTSAPASEATIITTRPVPTASRTTNRAKKTVTPRPTSGPRIRSTTWSPSSTYPPPLFSSFSSYDSSAQSASGDNSGNSALFGATRAFSQFLGAAISGAAQQLQSLVRNGTKIVSDVVG